MEEEKLERKVSDEFCLRERCSQWLAQTVLIERSEQKIYICHQHHGILFQPQLVVVQYNSDTEHLKLHRTPNIEGHDPMKGINLNFDFL